MVCYKTWLLSLQLQIQVDLVEVIHLMNIVVSPETPVNFNILNREISEFY